MVTVIGIDGTAHTMHPEKKESKTFCGKQYDAKNSQISAFALYVESAFAQFISSNENINERCEECLKNGKQWAESR